MSELIDPLLGWGVFNLLLAVILFLRSIFARRLGQGRRRGSTRRFALFRAPEPRVRPWEPFVEALEARRVTVSARKIPSRD
jgi:hypothetical protein